MERARSIGLNAFRRHRRDLRELAAHPDLRLYLAVLAVVLLSLVFFELADAVAEPGTIAIDNRILLALRDAPGNPIGPAWMERFWIEITTLGSATVLSLVSLIATGCLLILRRFRLVLTLIAGVLGGWGLSAFLKQAIARPRPDVVEHLTAVTSLSFPSGHSMMSAVIYLTLAALIARLMEKRRLKLYALGTAIALTCLVGASRVYLGVHWPSDVLAGWSAGAAWALLSWLIARRIGLGRDSER
jgi:undecaprenyl-diphosphatase